MGGALLMGWLDAEDVNVDITVVEPEPHKSITSLPINIVSGPHELENYQADIVVLALKPQVMGQALPAYLPMFHENTVAVSIAAGKTIENIRRIIGLDKKVVRVMPNLPATVGEGATGCIADHSVTNDEKVAVSRLFKAVGEVVWLSDEGLMDALTGVSGSGPAYFFYFVECLTEAGKAAGLSEDEAYVLAAQTLVGAAQMVKTSEMNASQLREQVTSPGGTTAAGLEVMMKDDRLKKMLVEVVEAAKNRGQELSG